MTSLRRWQLDARAPLSLTLAADARLSSTDYTDDQVWELLPGVLDSPALALQTHYGGRVGLASLVPMWVIDSRTVYQAQAYAKPPVVTAFAPGYLQLEAKITPTLALRAEYRAMESHAVGGRFTLGSTDNKPASLRLDLFGHVAASGKEQSLALLPVSGGGAALLLGHAGNLRPVVLLENARAVSESPKLGAALTVPPGGKVSVRWAHAGLRDVDSSLALARRWLRENWTSAVKDIAEAAEAIPVIETGDEELDATIAFSLRQMMQAYLKPTASLPYASFVAARQADRGFSPRGDGSDHLRAWSGQNPTQAYLLALGTASIAPELAQGIVRNYLAVQQDDGWIDWKPGLAGQRRGVLCLPLLARMAWGVFQYSEDAGFLRDVFPGLLRFFRRWLRPDLDADGDGIPEWQAEVQTGYPYMPTFAVGLPYGQHADIRFVEAPDLMAYLLSEAISLREIAYYLNDAENGSLLETEIERLKAALESLWRERRYAYRDRDTHETAGSAMVLEGGSGNEAHFPALDLDPANRLIVRVSGGWEHTPRMTLHLDGADRDGQPLHESADSDAFVWTHSRGVYTSRNVFSRIDRIRFEGLIRVYRVDVTTLDTTRLDLSALLPLWSVGIAPERAEALIALATDAAHFWRANGVTMCSARDPLFDPANEKGAGGVWTFWLTLIGEGFIEHNRSDLAAEMLKRLLKTQVAALKAQKVFSEFYSSAAPRGLGEKGHLAGVAPIHLLLRALGIRIISPGKVWTGGAFAWQTPVTVTQHGVSVRRDANGTTIRFPSGYTIDLPGDAPFGEIADPHRQAPQPASGQEWEDPFGDAP